MQCDALLGVSRSQALFLLFVVAFDLSRHQRLSILQLGIEWPLLLLSIWQKLIQCLVPRASECTFHGMPCVPGCKARVRHSLLRSLGNRRRKP